ncbi:MAG: pilus assembly protein CpaE [Acidimicrobiia bacterium]
MISIELARKLRDAGLEWLPTEGDRFMIPDRDLEDHVFSISEMTIEVRRLAEGRRIMFNGSVEWALDSILQHEVIWLPSEAQLRDRLGRAFDNLQRTADGYRCEVIVDARRKTYYATDPAEAYGRALLDLLEDPDTMLRLIVED